MIGCEKTRACGGEYDWRVCVTKGSKAVKSPSRERERERDISRESSSSSSSAHISSNIIDERKKNKSTYIFTVQ